MPVAVTDAQPRDLLGVWRLDRRVHDRRAGLRGRVTGTLELSDADGRVRWFERGVLRWDGRALEVTRELHLTLDPGGWMVRFDDGREFHPWRPGHTVRHPCRADTYEGLVAVDPARTVLRVLWDVHGPDKDQRLLTRCTRR